VNILVLAVLGACFLHWSRKQSFRAGLWLALAAAIKVLPGLLLLLVLVRRNGRMVLGLAVGLFVSLGIVPAMVWGIDGAIDMNRTFLSRVAGPSVTNGGDATIHKEFSGTTSTDSQAFHAIIHAWRHPDRDARPDVSDGISKGLHYAIGLALLAMVLFAAWKQRMELDDPVRLLLAFGSICVVMVHIAPASHMHYYSYSLPLIAGLLFENLRWHPTRAVPTRPVLLGFAAWFTGTLLPLIDTDPSFVALRDRGLAVAANLGLLAWGVARLLRAKKV